MNDVIIIGGGPAGSAMGSYLSMMGIDNIIIEQAIHPRPHVGESMVTSSTRVFKEIGFLSKMEEAGFPHKYGAAWHPIMNGDVAVHTSSEAAIEFREFPQEGVDQDYTYHVDRSKFDLMLLKHAEELGSQVYQGVRVTRVLFEDGQAVGVQVRIGNQEVELPAKVVVDASGRNTLLGRQLRIKKNDPIFDQYAVHAWFEGVNREGPTGDFIHIHFLPVKRGWAWQIPISDKVTSIGVVTERDVFRQAGMDLESFFNTYVESNYDLAQAMRNATQVNELMVEGDYSYSMERFVGDGFLLVGDAARFVDPIFSSGVSVALYSAKFAAERIQEAFARNDFSEAIFRPYEEKLRVGVEIWYEFICLYYKLLPLFTYFIQSRKYRLQVLRLLQGDVFERSEVTVLDEMRKFIETVENTENHLFKSQLSEIPI